MSRDQDALTLAGRLTRALLPLLLSGTLTSCGPGGKFSPVRLDAEVEQYRRIGSTSDSLVEIQRIPDGLRCIVLANPDPTRTHSGGLMIPLHGAKGCRFQLAFTDSAGVVVVYADGYNADRKRVARWKTEPWTHLRREKTTFLFRPQQSTKLFRPVAAEASGSIESLQVFVDIIPGAGAAFEVTNVEAIR